ncbi:MAG: hypothetical protein GY754_27875 [bacterium]|nr:hypothetical protein [bacterium]
MKNFVKYGIFAAAVLFVLCFIAILVLADREGLPSFIVMLYRFPGGDKVGHFFLMGFLSLFVNSSLVLTKRGSLPQKIFIGTVILAFLVSLEELSQLYFKGRTFSLVDLGCSFAGIVFFAGLVFLIARKRSRRV